MVRKRASRSNRANPLQRLKAKHRKYTTKHTALSHKVNSLGEKYLRLKAKKTPIALLQRKLIKWKRTFLKARIKALGGKIRRIEKRFALSPKGLPKFTPVGLGSIKGALKSRKKRSSDRRIGKLILKGVRLGKAVSANEKKIKEMKLQAAEARRLGKAMRQEMDKFARIHKQSKAINLGNSSFEGVKEMYEKMAKMDLGKDASKEAIKEKVIDLYKGSFVKEIEIEREGLLKEFQALMEKAEADFRNKNPVVSNPTQEELRDFAQVHYREEVGKLLSQKKEIDLKEEFLPSVQKGIEAHLRKYYELQTKEAA